MEGLSQKLARLSPEKRKLLLLALQQRGAEFNVSPLSFAQQRLWFLYNLEPGSAAYNIPAAFRLRGPLKIALLEQSINTIVQRHDALRTFFLVIDGLPVQVVQPTLSQALSITDLSALQPDQQAVQVQAAMAQEAHQPFTLDQLPLLRCRILRLSPEEHVFLLTVHHIIADGWSTSLFMSELSQLYNAYLHNRPATLAELPIQYPDFARWQREWLQGEVLSTQLAYWTQQLQDLPAPLALPTDRPRPAVQSFRGAIVRQVFPKPLGEAFKALCHQEEATLFMGMLAAFGMVLARYSGQDDMVIGSPVANRQRPETKAMIGLFVNTIALRVNLAGNPRFREVLRRVHDVAVAAYAHQDLPFEKLVEELQPKRTLSQNPIFQVMFDLQSVASTLPELSGLKVERLTRHNKVAAFDMTLAIEDTPQGLRALVEYNTDLFDASTIQRLLDHLHTLLEGIVAQPDQRLQHYGLLTAKEREELLAGWTADKDLRPEPVCVHRLFAAQAARTPDAIAAIDAQGSMTYAELNRRANRLAHYLCTLGVGPEMRIGLCIERSFDLLIGMLGVLKAGGAYVPLDPAYPAERLAFILHDAQIAVLLTQQHLVSQLPAQNLQVVPLDTSWPAIDQHSDDEAKSDVDPGNVAYVIYTSGSTGQPKGVLTPHQAVANHSRAIADCYELQPTDRVLQFASISFDVAAEEIFPTWYRGGAVVLRPSTDVAAPADLLRIVHTASITVVNLPTPYWQEVLYELARTRGPLPATLRLVVIGSEQVQAEHVAQWRSLVGEYPRWCNAYGPTEATITATVYRPWHDPDTEHRTAVPIGRPIAHMQAYVLDGQLQPVPISTQGELYLSGAGLAHGYLNRPALTAEQFIPNPFGNQPGARLYRTGDMARVLPSGDIVFLGRGDHQIKLRGFRIELGEIEAALHQHPAVRQAVVLACDDEAGNAYLAAYVTPSTSVEESELRRFAQRLVPSYMVPAAFVLLDEFPLTPHGKVDRRALPAVTLHRGVTAMTEQMPQTAIEHTIAAIWQEVLQTQHVGIHENFFDVGGQSLLMMRVHSRLSEVLQREISLVDLFQYSTIHSLARFLSQPAEDQRKPALQAARTGRRQPTQQTSADTQIAIIGLAGRFPGASELEQFWQNLARGIESVSFFSDEELAAAGVPARVLNDPSYVRAKASLADIALFDAGFFGFTPREAEGMDPQHRFFLECAWEGLEHAGYDPTAYDGRIGVYAGVSSNSYLRENLSHHPELLEALGSVQVAIGNDRDHLTTLASYKLNLKGPSITVQTACSTSLVAVHLACQSILDGECDIALAGGVSIDAEQTRGYIYQSGSVLSPDGHCRAFDALAQGTVRGNGIGIVVLKRLVEALADGDYIHAVIKGSAINNDGSAKVGYTAPSTTGQAEVIAEALAVAGVEPDTITYVETHGTGTALGDPIEIAALTQAFQGRAETRNTCAIGALKTNIGHLDVAAGVAGLIKTALMLSYKQIPPTLHFEQSNPRIDFASSPFYVNTSLREWHALQHPRRAGVSSFGMGGTNAHLVLEEAPPPAPVQEAPQWHVLVLSARTKAALDAMTARLAEHLTRHPELRLADVAHTLQVGRRAFGYRRALVCRDRDDALALLASGDPQRVFTSIGQAADPTIAFMFSGQGSQYVNMAREWYEREPTFRAAIDSGADALKAHLGVDLRTLLYPEPDASVAATAQLQQTLFAQPALFVIEYALAQMWQAWGVHPQALIGHSIGEYVAACVAGVFNFEDGLAIVAARAQLMQQVPSGAMLAVPLPEDDVHKLLTEALTLAAVNGPALCVVAGPTPSIEGLEQRLEAEGISYRRLHTSHAFHSAMMEPILHRFHEQISGVALHPPQIPYISNLTGRWITADEATSPQYWVDHLRHTVRFNEGLQLLLQHPRRVLLEVGPGRALTTLAKQPAQAPGQVAIASLRHPQDQQSDIEYTLNSLSQLWLAGVPVNWGAVQPTTRRRVPLPTYPFERQRYWVEAKRMDAAERAGRAPAEQNDVASWLYRPSWQQILLPTRFDPRRRAAHPCTWLIFLGQADQIGLRIGAALEQSAQSTVYLRIGAAFRQDGTNTYTINPDHPEHYDALLQTLSGGRGLPLRVLYLGGVVPDVAQSSELAAIRAVQATLCAPLLTLVRALDRHAAADQIQLWVVSNNLYAVESTDCVVPAYTALTAVCQVVAQECAGIICRTIDADLSCSDGSAMQRVASQILAECFAQPGEAAVAYRGGQRWVRSFSLIQPPAASASPPLRTHGTYLISAGLEEPGFGLTYHIAQSVQPTLILLEHESFPARAEWRDWLETRPVQDRVRQKIEKLLMLEELGANVELLEVPGTSREHVAAMVDSRYDELHGVIHVLEQRGNSGGRLLRELDIEAYQDQLADSIQHIAVLADLMQERTLDFCLLVSSLPELIGSAGDLSACAAALYMSARAQQQRTQATPWISVHWDTWQSTATAAEPIECDASSAFVSIDGQMTRLFNLVLSMTALPQILVSPIAIQDRLAQRAMQAAPDPEATAKIEQSTADSSSVERLYVVPTNDIEWLVADIWQKMFGINQISTHDNFFDLGGHSLLATQILSRVRQVFKMDVALDMFFTAPTVSELAQLLVRQERTAGQVTMIARLWKQVERMSADEVRVALGVAQSVPE